MTNEELRLLIQYAKLQDIAVIPTPVETLERLLAEAGQEEAPAIPQGEGGGWMLLQVLHEPRDPGCGCGWAGDDGRPWVEHLAEAGPQSM